MLQKYLKNNINFIKIIITSSSSNSRINLDFYPVLFKFPLLNNSIIVFKIFKNHYFRNLQKKNEITK